jgi:hypothetical protein
MIHDVLALCVLFADARPTWAPRRQLLALSARQPTGRRRRGAPIAGAALPRRLTRFTSNLAVGIGLLKIRQVVGTERRVRLQAQLEFVLE